MENNCPKTTKCPLYNGKLLKRVESFEAYKHNYCSDVKRYCQCKRFIIAEKFGKCADFIMPNSLLTLEEIERRMMNEGMLT